MRRSWAARFRSSLADVSSAISSQSEQGSHITNQSEQGSQNKPVAEQNKAITEQNKAVTQDLETELGSALPVVLGARLVSDLKPVPTR